MFISFTGGAGGKGTWGALGSELAEEELDGAIDTNDPNYDETNPENKEIKMKVIHVDRSDEEIQVQTLLRRVIVILVVLGFLKSNMADDIATCAALDAIFLLNSVGLP